METPPSENPVEIPAQIPDEPVSTAVFPAQNSIGEKISGALSRTAEKFNLPFRRKGGRPPKAEHELKYPRRRPLQGENPFADNGGHVENDFSEPGAKTIPVDFPEGEKPDNVFSRTPAHSPVSEIFRKACGSGIKGAFGILNTITKFFCDRAGYEKNYTEKVLAECKPDKEVLDNTIESFDVVCKKRGWQPKNAEEYALAMNVGHLVAPYSAALVDIVRHGRQVQTALTDYKTRIAKLEATIEKLYAEKTAA